MRMQIDPTALYQIREQSSFHWVDVALGRSFPKANTIARRLLPSGTRTLLNPMGGMLPSPPQAHPTAAQTRGLKVRSGLPSQDHGCEQKSRRMPMECIAYQNICFSHLLIGPVKCILKLLSPRMASLYEWSAGVLYLHVEIEKLQAKRKRRWRLLPPTCR